MNSESNHIFTREEVKKIADAHKLIQVGADDIKFIVDGALRRLTDNDIYNLNDGVPSGS